MRAALTIGKAAQEAGVNVETIRFYERQGLIEQPPKIGGAARRYAPETVERVRFIREGQHLGFTLREIRELLALRTDPLADCAEVRQQAVAKRDEVQKKIRRLHEISSALDAHQPWSTFRQTSLVRDLIPKLNLFCRRLGEP